MNGVDQSGGSNCFGLGLLGKQTGGGRQPAKEIFEDLLVEKYGPLGERLSIAGPRSLGLPTLSELDNHE